MTEPHPRIGIVNLGCPKASVDSERILTQLRAEGYEIAPSYKDADLVVVKACGFIEAAIDESLCANLHHHTDEWHSRAWRSNAYDLARGLGELGVWVRLLYVYPYPHAGDRCRLLVKEAGDMASEAVH